MRRAIAAYNAGLNGIETFASLFYSALRFRRKARHAFRAGDEILGKAIIVAMNGPTLNRDLARAEAAIASPSKIDYAVANHFADTTFFAEARPSHYFFSDPYFWDNGSDPSLIEKRIATFVRIRTQTTWPMQIYFPAHADISAFKEYFAHHESISLQPFNAAALPSYYSWLLGFAWDMGFCAPYGQNVLIHALYGAVRLGYSQIAVAGAGFSFHEQIHVDQRNNTFYKRRTHVYGETTERAFTDQSKKVPATVLTEFKALFNAFRSLEALAKYSSFRNCEIINCSDYSYLDMFKRPGSNEIAQEHE